MLSNSGLLRSSAATILGTRWVGQGVPGRGVVWCTSPVGVLWWQVRKQYRRRFRGSAAKVVVRFFRAFIVSWMCVCVCVCARSHRRWCICAFPLTLQRYRFLMYIHDHLPSTSPVEKRWPRVPPFFREASHLLRIMHHKWRVRGGGRGRVLSEFNLTLPTGLIWSVPVGP